MKKFFFLFSFFFFFLLPSLLRAQVPIEPSRYDLTKISTQYFGPYAFPVPENNQGRVCSKFKAELAFDYVKGSYGDHTYAPTFLISAPLWTDRASISIWGEFHEWYQDTPESHSIRRISDQYSLEGHDGGNLYLSVDFLALRERKYVPSIALRAILLTATGDDYEKARHYDAPGYAFDLTIGKDFNLSKTSEHILRASAGIGFVCWQVDRGTQNDALMFEAGLSYRNKWLDLETSYGQYTGRIGRYASLEGDRPKSIKARAGFTFGMFTPFLYFQQGLEDYPFSQFRIGLSFSMPVLKNVGQ